MSDDTQNPTHRGLGHSAPYPLSRLAPAFGASELTAELDKAEAMLGARTSAKLRVIADQIRALQAEAGRILAQAREEQLLTRAQCAFKRIPGKTYHFYRKADGAPFFSMLSPADWRGTPPHEFLGSYRLEPDYSWTPEQGASQTGDTGELVRQLLAIGGVGTGEGGGR
jgi:hypothetical protein